MNAYESLSHRLRRAAQTALMGFHDVVIEKGVKVVANDLCHEIGGYHTCDRRQNTSELRVLYPSIDFSEVTAEEDPLWLDGTIRESWTDLAIRAASFVNYLYARDEHEIVVTSHSSFLLALFNAVLDTDTPETSKWFATGELRCVQLLFEHNISETNAKEL